MYYLFSLALCKFNNRMGNDEELMKVVEHLANAKKTPFSFEIVPPPRGRTVKDIVDIVKAIQPLDPPWIDVTAHSAGAYYNEKNDGSVERRIYKKRPGTVGICGIIQNRFKIDTVTHLLCQGFTKEETEDALIELNFLGIHNVLAIRGDDHGISKPISKDKSINTYAVDLVEQIKAMNQGLYLEKMLDAEPTDFCVGVAAYPEKHFEAPNLAWDIKRLQEKINSGADYIVTQLFYDNQVYFDFLKECREAGITVPIIPGLKVLTTASHITSLPKSFHINIPAALSDEVASNPSRAREIGIEWASMQAKELLAHNVCGLHYYIMANPSPAVKVIESLGL